MKVKLKTSDNKIPYSSSCMGFSPSDRIRLNSGEVVELDSIPDKGKGYVEAVSNSTQKSAGGKK
tara:strand:+ start:2562 stop:2753 length:192 start_codon:yes stop_codon:yes gene_type:complete